MIGQFGVGFYSAFLVAERVQVHSKHPAESAQWCWESEASGDFRLGRDPLYPSIKRGTHVVLWLKREQRDSWTDARTIRQTVHRYSQFVQYPIQLRCTQEVEEEEEEEQGQQRQGEPEQTQAADVQAAASARAPEGRAEGAMAAEAEATGRGRRRLQESWELLNQTRPSASSAELS